MDRNLLKKIIVVVIIGAVIVAFKIFNLGEYFSLSYIKESRDRCEILYAEHALLVIAAYMAIYIAVTSLSLPGAAVITLAGGALFGLLIGPVVVSFASSAGATLARFVSRFILRDWVQSNFGDRLKTINDGVEREGPFYLFTLPLIPVSSPFGS